MRKYFCVTLQLLFKITYKQIPNKQVIIKKIMNC